MESNHYNTSQPKKGADCPFASRKALLWEGDVYHPGFRVLGIRVSLRVRDDE
jgi:hypothetical protein